MYDDDISNGTNNEDEKINCEDHEIRGGIMEDFVSAKTLFVTSLSSCHEKATVALYTLDESAPA